MSFAGRNDGLNFTPAGAVTSVTAPIATSIDTRRVFIVGRVSWPFSGLGLGRLVSSVSSRSMQYAITRALSAENFGLPQKLPCSPIRFSPVPSGWMT